MVLLRARTLALNLLIGIAVFLPMLASAQGVGMVDPIVLSVDPQYPVPYSQIVVTPSSGVYDLPSSIFVLAVNGKEIYRGNAKSVPVMLSAAGTPISIKGTLISNGASDSETITVRPQDVSLVAEPVSSAPVLYPGKPLVPLQGTVRIVAVANLRSGSGIQSSPNTLSYTWTVGGATIASISGIGKNSVVVESPLEYRPGTVAVAVSTQDGSLVGGASLVLSAKEPVVRLYENDSLLGIRFDHALGGSYNLSAAEESLFGVPYSFPVSNEAPALEWFLNGISAQIGPSITLRPTGTGKGSASVSLSAGTSDGPKTTANLSVIFGAGQSTNIFGL